MRGGDERGGLLESESTRLALGLVRLYSRFNRPIVFVGPVGVGKTMLAKEVVQAAQLSGRLVAIGSGELGEDLYADTLFGHVAGAFTSASAGRRGAFSEAAGGALLLDDLAYMHRAAQAAILRVMESGAFRPLGSEKDERSSCRMLFATTVEPEDLVADGRLVRDLKSRLGELVIRVPPLADRREEILPIARRCARDVLAEHSLDAAVTIADDAALALERYSWPENVRELQSVMVYAVLHAGIVGGSVVIRRAHLPKRISEPDTGRSAVDERDKASLIDAALRDSGGNQSEAARTLGFHRNTIGRYLRRKR